MDVVTLGMLTLDDIIIPGNLQESTCEIKYTDVLGGAGTFAVLGARLVAAGKDAPRIGWVVHVGDDFPPEVKRQIDFWSLRTKYIRTPGRLTTRAENVYEGEHRGFRFLTDKIQVIPTMLDHDQLQAKVFHIIGTPERSIDVVLGIMNERKALSPLLEAATFVWEPIENSCNPANIDKFSDAMKLVDVFSPNEEEFAQLTDCELFHSENSRSKHMHYRDIKHHSHRFANLCGLQAVVVRLGSAGVYVGERDHHVILPAYHGPCDSDQSRVVDVTGGGNSFLGAYCYALANPQTFKPNAEEYFLTLHQHAAFYGSVAASFVIEQIGIPSFTTPGESKSGGDNETWNGESVRARWVDLKRRYSQAAFGTFVTADQRSAHWRED